MEQPFPSLAFMRAIFARRIKRKRKFEIIYYFWEIRKTKIKLSRGEEEKRRKNREIGILIAL